MIGAAEEDIGQLGICNCRSIGVDSICWPQISKSGVSFTARLVYNLILIRGNGEVELAIGYQCRATHILLISTWCSDLGRRDSKEGSKAGKKEASHFVCSKIKV